MQEICLALEKYLRCKNPSISQTTYESALTNGKDLFLLQVGDKKEVEYYSFVEFRHSQNVP